MTTILTKLNKTSNGKNINLKIGYTIIKSGVWVDYYQAGKLLRNLSGIITDEAARNQCRAAIKDGYRVRAMY